MKNKYFMIKKSFIFIALFFSFTSTQAQNGLSFLPNPVPNPGAKRDMQIHSNGDLYVLFPWTYGVFNINSNTWQIIDTNVVSFQSAQLYKILLEGDSIIIATSKGLSIFNGTSWSSFLFSSIGISNSVVNALYRENQNYWIGTNHGLIKFNTSFTLFNNLNNGLLNDTIRCISGTFDGEYLWFGTRDGIIQLTNNSFINITPLNSDLPVGIVSALFYNHQKLWIRSSFQTAFFTYNGNSFDFTSLSDRYLSNNTTSNFNYPSGILVNENGTVYSIDESSIKFIWSGVNINSVAKYSSLDNKYYILPFPGISIQAIDFSLYNFIEDSGSTENDFSNINMDKNEVKAMIRATGEMFWDRAEGSSKFEFPKNSGKHAHFASALWIGGLDSQGLLHTACQTYRQIGNDIWPGPVNPITASVTDAISNLYNKVWKVNKKDIEEFIFNYAIGNVQNGSYMVAQSILDWPAVNPYNANHGLAPYVDINNDGLYNPLLHGDYPKIQGDQYFFWVMNDLQRIHTETSGDSLGLEIQASAWSHSCAALPDSLKALNSSLFFKYNIINRSSNNYSNTYLGLWNDYDLGNYSDDAVGTDSLNNFVFVYNADSVDQFNVYGSHIPTNSLKILNGPLAQPNDGIDNNNNGIVDEPGEKALLSGSLSYQNNATSSGNPSTAQHHYNYLKGIYKDGTPQTSGGTGYGGITPTRFSFFGQPWNSSDWNNTLPADWRILTSSGPFLLNAGDTATTEFAHIVSYDSLLVWGTEPYYQNMIDNVRSIGNWYQNSGQTGCDTVGAYLSLSSNNLNVCNSNPTVTLTIQSSQSLNPNNTYTLLIDNFYWGLSNPIIVNSIASNSTNISFQFTIPDNYFQIGSIKLKVISSSPTLESNILLINLIQPPPFPQFSISQNLLNSYPAQTNFINPTPQSGPYNYTWSFGDGSSLQSNDALLTHTYNTNGVFHVGLTITDTTTGCSATNFDPNNSQQSVICNVSSNNNCGYTPLISPSGVINACIGGTVNISINSTSYPAGATFQWNKNGVALSGENFTSYNATSNGFYSVTVFDTSGCPVQSSPTQLIFNLPAAQTPTITQSGQIGNCGIVNATLTANGNFGSYIWNTGQIGNSINVTEAGIYTVVGQAGTGCDASSAPVNISSSVLSTPEICMITVDSITNQSIIVWEKDVTNAISGYGIYKETAFNSNNYQQIAVVAYDSLSEYMDINSDAEVIAERYRISIIDTCGGETSLSSVARAIGLKVFPGLGVQRSLSWNAYVGSNQNITLYKIYSGPNYSQLTLLDTVPANISNYLDPSPVNGLNTVYRVYADLSQDCASTRAVRNKSISNGTGNIQQPFVQSISEIGDNDKLDFNIFPNPNNGLFTLVLSDNNATIASIYDITGKLLVQEKLMGKTNTMNLQALSRGTYIVQVIDNKGFTAQRLVVIN
jgi:hypothetical protein